jgi:hypothetical protein
MTGKTKEINEPVQFAALSLTRQISESTDFSPRITASNQQVKNPY